MVIFEDTQLDFSDVLIKPSGSNLTSRKDVNVKRKYKFKWCPYEVNGTGIMQSNMGTIGNFEVSKKMLDTGMFACLHKHHDVDSLSDFYRGLSWGEKRRCFLSIGLRDNGLEKIRELYNRGVFFGPSDEISICIDVPNGYIRQVEDLVIKIRKEFPNCLLMVGNVVTSGITRSLIINGADIVKVGIGNGAQCRTRIQTGVGRPQFSTIVDCAEIAHETVGGMVCSDGGITCPGDICKAFGGGADFIMIGSLYAGTDEAEGEIIEKAYLDDEVEVLDKDLPSEYHNIQIRTEKFKLFYGMSSNYAQEKFGNGKPKYRASEGRVSIVPYCGSIDDVNEEFLGGLRSMMTYIGAETLGEIPEKCTFYRVNNQFNKMYEKTTIGK